MAGDPEFQTSPRQRWGCSKGPPSSWVAVRLTQEWTQGTQQGLGGQRTAGVKTQAARGGRGGSDCGKGEGGLGPAALSSWRTCALRACAFAKAPDTHVGLRGGSLTCPIWNYILASGALPITARSHTKPRLGGPTRPPRGPAPAGCDPCKTRPDWPFERGPGLARACALPWPPAALAWRVAWAAVSSRFFPPPRAFKGLKWVLSSQAGSFLLWGLFSQNSPTPTPLSRWWVRVQRVCCNFASQPCTERQVSCRQVLK